jgi:dihydroorotate dehydrogenase (fumarate)
MYSLFEEQLHMESLALDHYLHQHSESFAEAVSYLPDLETYRVGPEPYLEQIAAAKQALNIPVIGSLNGSTPGGWTQHAKLIQQAGADALELNLYFLPTDPFRSGVAVESDALEVVREVRSCLTIPLSVKLSPYWSSVAYMANQFAREGVAGLVLFNRFYQPDLDLEQLEVTSALRLSDSTELRLPLRWVALLHGRVPADFAITSGIHDYLDALKALMAGARVTMLASALLEHGPGHLREIRQTMTRWLEERDYESVRQLQGSMSAERLIDPAAFERANYLRVLDSWKPLRSVARP